MRFSLSQTVLSNQSKLEPSAFKRRKMSRNFLQNIISPPCSCQSPKTYMCTPNVSPTFQKMPSQNFKPGDPTPRHATYSLSSVLMVTLCIAVIPLLTLMSSGLSHQVPSYMNAGNSWTAPFSSPTNTATTTLDLNHQDTDYTVIDAQGIYVDGHIVKDDDRKSQATTWTSAQRIPPDWAGGRFSETTSRIASRTSNKILPDDPSTNANDQSSVSNVVGIPTEPSTGSSRGDLKRSAGIFVVIKAIILSWAILLVGMLSFMIARYAGEILAEEPSLEAEPDEDDERTALLDHYSV